MASKYDNTIVIPPSSPEQNWARSVSPCTPARLFGLSPLSPSPPSLLSPSKLFEEVRPGTQNDPNLPLVQVVGKAAASIATAGSPLVSENLTKTGRPGSSKAKTVRNRKSSKSQETQNKILTGRVAKATTASKAKDTTVSKSKAGTKKTKAGSKSEDEELGKKAEAKTVVNAEGLDLEGALKRRSDWTPTKASVVISLDEDSPSGNSVAKASFGDALREYHYSRENSVPERLPPRKEGNPTKRRRVELVEFEILQERKPFQPKQTKDIEKAPKMKPKPKKQPKTITARMTALYEPINETEGLFVFEEESEAGEGSKKPAKPKKRTATKRNEPEYVILSPNAATKSLNDQYFMFGTCSQLERDDSPTFDETQKALQLSESLAFEENPLETISMIPSTTSIATRYSGKKSHWSEAARDFRGAVIQPEIIDMTDSPSIDTALSRLSQMSREAPKMASPVSVKATPTIKPVIEKNILPSSEPAADAQSTISKSKSDNAGFDNVDSITEPAIMKPTRRLPEMPNFNGHTDEELKKEITSYGLKAIRGRKKMIALLEKCWQSKHGKTVTFTNNVQTSSSAATNATASVPTTQSSDPQVSEKLPGRKKQTKSSDGEPKTTNRAGKKKVADKPPACKVETVAEKAPSQKRSSTYMVDEIEDSEEEIIPSPNRIRMQRQSSSRQTTPAINCLPLGNKSKRPSAKNKASTFDESALPELQSSITKAIHLQTRPQKSLSSSSRSPQLTWHEKILLYEPIILEDFAAWLNTEGFALAGEDREVGVALVRTWCESQGICCTFRA